MAQTAVMGAGSWGTAFAMVLADAGNDVRLWGRRPVLCEAINSKHENSDYLPGIALPHEITATHDPAEAMADAEIVVLAVPSQQLRDNLKSWSEHVPAGAVMVSLMKGVELGTHKRMSEVIAEITGAGPERIAVVSGPNLAREIANREPAASVVACEDQGVAERLQKLCHSASFRPYSMTDVIGCELAGTAKNIIGLAVGVCVGLGYGDNTKASVITRGLAETARLGAVIGADPVTFMGLAGMGDLVATCSSPLSRNRTFGEKLGQGMSVEEVTAQTSQVAEGVKSCVSVSELAKLHDVEMPIVEHVAALIAGEMSPDELVARLISRQAKPETD
ncbi:NAD(P)H-dependent glycerol-3-phosphate dehydrogenase [Aeromicrobium sp. 9AM]|uniref:NAD(P)H-dependent glycerol-3-phosphate dehydrogenase n=1 Tax=Aeromicrobium sp. 9AM TaxID=2653126 RepID=UPI0012F0ED1D|nr:NAD(P)H-dependent glycerol-3-phosphate dehydrogenase [Aeromicrobium sp. 9AM]VXC10688.1 Glycerol-3-phosphate dehydrogenase (NAD(P)+) [Aeromicrobium sp. 9AM]